ncbi:MAG: glycerophosphodiester phosphodiesterase [Robiginitomaculum sp.]
MITMDHLISHRFRGFAARENTLTGLTAALDFGVKYLEFDIRIAACGTPMIYHDAAAKDGAGKKRKLNTVKAARYGDIGGAFAHFPSFEALLETVAAHPFKGAQLLIDIKDAGFEVEITALVNLYRLQDRVTYVSWLPEVLYACHALEPHAPLCLSHWCKKPNRVIRTVHKLYFAKKGHIARDMLRSGYISGESSGWFVDGSLAGEMADMIARTKGSICVPVAAVTKPLVEAYHAMGIEVSVFSYVDMKKALAHQKSMNIDLYFVDKMAVFDAL